ncbi:MAG TPA: YbaK/EbsC family protein [Phototrophicaceae bacterium]|nr:YbaK/EbsC family protein [Phototrophicaceae bacterium]
MDQRIIERLKAQGAQFRIHEHLPIRTVADAIEKALFPPERCLTTVALRLKRGDWVLVGKCSPGRVDYKKLAAALAVKRSKIRCPSPDEVLAVLGLEAGAVSPIPTIAEVRVIFDMRVPAQETLFTGIGRTDRTLEITLSELLRVTQGQIADIVADKEAV